MSQKLAGDGGPPRAEITKTGRWTYEINIIQGITSTGPRFRLGRSAAERCARLKLAWWIRKFGTPREHWTIP